MREEHVVTRRWKWSIGAVVLAVVAGVAALPAQAAVRLPHVFGSHMVLQRNIDVPVWGWADPGEEVAVAIAGNQAKAKADANGRWSAKLPPMKAGGPHTMTVAASNTITLTDVLVGEVWVGSGQSNMQMSVHGVVNAKQEVAAAKYPNIRLFYVPLVPAGEPAPDTNASWRVCSPRTVGGFSAALYFFGRELHKQLGVPFGLINTSWGGTRVEPWTPPEGFKSEPKLAGYLKQIEQANAAYRKAIGPMLDRLEPWIPKARKALAAGEQVPPMPQIARHTLDNRGRPTGLYNGMVHPIVPFAIRGAIWYQGEANLGDGSVYFQKMKALIAGWRAVWKQGDFPFYLVQLAPFRYRASPLLLPVIWEAQAATLAVPNTGMAVTTDITTLNNIHPPNKQDVGKRLALWALAKDYGRKDTVHSGPLYKSLAIEGAKARLTFDHTGGGLASRDGKPLTWFEIAGADKKFVKAQATLDGNTVVVASPEVPKPVAVRFGWHQLAEPNLMNKEGLPASPFRTHKW